MKFCQPHWDALRAAVDARGMGALVPDSGERAVSNLVDQSERGPSVDNFDPLMGAHNAILGQAMHVIRERYQQNPLMVMADDAEHPEWACPICALNWCHEEHTRLCTQEGCNYPKVHDWSDVMINGSTDFMLAEWKKITDA